MENLNVLIVEDEAIIAADLAARLAKFGYRVVEHVTSGEEAILSARRLQPDIALVDVELAGQVDGIQAGEYLTRSLNIPVVFLTAHAGAEVVERAKKIEPYAYLLKPFHEEELAISLDIACYRARMSAERDQAVREMLEARQYASGIIDSCLDVIVALNESNRIVEMNRAGGLTLGFRPEDMRGKPVGPIFAQPGEIATIQKQVREHGREYRETVIRRRDGQSFPALLSASPLKEPDGRLMGMVVSLRDITDRKKAEDDLKGSYEEMERRVAERTADLREANDRLVWEIAERKQAESELSDKTRELLETVTALRVLVRQHEDERSRFESQIRQNIQRLISPHLDALQRSGTSDAQTTRLLAIRANLEDLVSPSADAMNLMLSKLTPREIEVADLVRQGKTSKEVAELLHISPKAVQYHRNSIRARLGLKQKGVNLQSYLLSLTRPAH